MNEAYRGSPLNTETVKAGMRLTTQMIMTTRSPRWALRNEDDFSLFLAWGIRMRSIFDGLSHGRSARAKKLACTVFKSKGIKALPANSPWGY
ncbi:hypothetical protein JCM15519_27290 [Fundidesulfovibrio butyratiphilus]